MTIVDRSTEKSDHESVGCKQSPFSSGDVRMDSSCSSSWTVGPTKSSDSLRLKSPGCLGSASGAAVFNTTPACVDRPKEQGGQLTLFLSLFPVCHTVECCLTSVARSPKPASKGFFCHFCTLIFFLWVLCCFISSFDLKFYNSIK